MFGVVFPAFAHDRVARSMPNLPRAGATRNCIVSQIFLSSRDGELLSFIGIHTL